MWSLVKLSPFVTSSVVLSCLVQMADISARLVQKADSLSALQLTGAFFTINWGTLCQTHLPPIYPYPQPPPPAPPPPPHFLDHSAAPARVNRKQRVWKSRLVVVVVVVCDVSGGGGGCGGAMWRWCVVMVVVMVCMCVCVCVCVSVCCEGGSMVGKAMV